MSQWLRRLTGRLPSVEFAVQLVILSRSFAATFSCTPGTGWPSTSWHHQNFHLPKEEHCFVGKWKQTIQSAYLNLQPQKSPLYNPQQEQTTKGSTGNQTSSDEKQQHFQRVPSKTSTHTHTKRLCFAATTKQDRERERERESWSQRALTASAGLPACLTVCACRLLPLVWQSWLWWRQWKQREPNQTPVHQQKKLQKRGRWLRKERRRKERGEKESGT